MQSGSLVSCFSFPPPRLAITASGTAARSRKLATLSSAFFGRQSRRVMRSAAVSKPSDATVIRRFPSPEQNAHSCALLGKETDTMNPYEKLEHAERAWTVAETAAFLGYSVKHLYRLIHQGKIEGWRRVEGGHIMFCPCKLKVWMENNFNGNGIHKPSIPEEQRKEDNGEQPKSI
jgi:excisionase family DNA binding protein